jgi:sarcosine/dimethylglycine N-methyltransferase
MNSSYSEKEQIAQSYYDNLFINKIYSIIWGGEDIHFGIYNQPNDSIKKASQRTIKMMAQTLQHIDQDCRVIDLGSGYGGSARYLAKNYGCSVCCLNVSTLQNQRNQQLNQAQNLTSLIDVKEGSYEDIPYPNESFDIVWLQDSMIHSGNRRQVLAESRRVLKRGGELIFTDTLQNDNCSSEQLQPAFNRLQVDDAGSFLFYRNTLEELGFKKISVVDLSKHVHTHYIRIREELMMRYDELIKQTSKEAIDNTLKSIEPWINFYQKGEMQWGLFHYYLPKNKK